MNKVVIYFGENIYTMIREKAYKSSLIGAGGRVLLGLKICFVSFELNFEFWTNLKIQGGKALLQDMVVGCQVSVLLDV